MWGFREERWSECHRCYMFEFLKAVGIMRGVFIIKLACMGTTVVRIQGQHVHQAMSHSNKLCVCLRGTELRRGQFRVFHLYSQAGCIRNLNKAAGAESQESDTGRKGKREPG